MVGKMDTLEIILQKVPYSKGINKDKTIRYIYTQFAPFFKRDLTYFLADEATRFKMYYEGGLQKDSPYVICKTLCEQYKRIYKDFSIESMVVETNTKIIPHSALLVHGENGWCFTDPLKDLFANQLGIRSEMFGSIPNDLVTEKYSFLLNLPKSYIENIDQELKILPFSIYLDTIFYLLHLEMTNNKKVANYFSNEDLAKNQFLLMQSKLRFMNAFLINLGNVPGLYERRVLYEYIFDSIFNRSELKWIQVELEQEKENWHLKVYLQSKYDQKEGIYEECKDSKSQYVLKKIK